MRTIAALALAAVIAAPALAEEDGFEPAERRAFLHATYDAKLAPTRLAFRLWRCNVAASKKLAERKGLDLVLRKIEDEAVEALASCSAEITALARDIPENANNLESIKAAIVRANVEVIKDTRNPPTVACAGDIPAAMCWRPWRR